MLLNTTETLITTTSSYDLFKECQSFFILTQQVKSVENDVVKMRKPMLEFYVNVKFTKMNDLVKNSEFQVVENMMMITEESAFSTPTNR